MWILAGIAVLSLAAWIATTLSPKLRTDHMTREEVIGVIERFLTDTPMRPWEWDDFLSVPLDDARLDLAREQCQIVHRAYPAAGKGYCNEEGLRVIQKVLEDLRAKGADA